MFQIHVDFAMFFFKFAKMKQLFCVRGAGLIILEVFQDFEYRTAVDVQNTSKVIGRIQVVPRIAILHSKWAIWTCIWNYLHTLLILR